LNFELNDMKVVLLKNVVSLGRAGEIKEVSEGYVRNFLLPRGLAEQVDKHAITVLEAQARKRERLKKEAEKDKIKIARKIDGHTFIILAKANETGSLYAKIDNEIIAEEIRKAGFEINVKNIQLPASIKKVGTYSVDLIFGNDKVKIILEIKSE
jgi:large subunit ribosomal protein L9